MHLAGIALAHGREVHAEAILRWTDWRLDPSVALGLALLAWAYRRASTRFAVEKRRAAAFWAGLLAIFVALESPLDRGGDHFLFTLHMIQHSLLMTVAAPLLAVATPPEAIVWARRIHRAAGAVIGWVSRGVPGFAVYNLGLVLWHLPALYEAALRSEAVHLAQHVSFLLLAYLFWVAILGEPGSMGPPAPVRLALVAGSMVVNWALSFTLALAGRPIYPTYAEAPRLWGLDPEADLALGAGLMWEMGNMAYGVAAVLLLRRYLKRDVARLGAGETVEGPQAAE
ncbi:MAG: cytochrome c oxidase assembly protein [Bacillota bacterium]